MEATSMKYPNSSLLFARGVIGLGFGAVAFLWPGMSLGELANLFGAYALLEGSLAVGTGNGYGGERDQRWREAVFEGILGIAAGVAALSPPSGDPASFSRLLGSWAIAAGALRLVGAVRLPMIEAAFCGSSGLVSLALGAVILIWPALGEMSLSGLFGSFAILSGGLFLAFGFKARGLMPPPTGDDTAPPTPQSANAPG